MSSAPRPDKSAAPGSFLEAFEEVSEAVESGAGLPAVVRAAARALDASVVVLDAAGGVVAVACLSPEDERAVLAGESGSEATALRVGDQRVGELRLRNRAAPPEAALLRMVTTLIAMEAERTRAPERATEAAVGDFLGDLLSRKVTDRQNILARAEELGCDLADGATVIVARARPHHAEEGDWRARVLTVAERGARAVERSALAATIELGALRSRAEGGPAGGRVSRSERDLVLLVPGAGPEAGRRAAKSALQELETGLVGFGIVVAVSRFTRDPSDLHRAGAEALLTANVAEADGVTTLAFEETGAYRLLLHEDPAELQHFYEETVSRLVDYDAQYETELLRTLESFLDADGNYAKTAEKLFTHRHTIRYRLDRVRELTSLDVGSSDGRERLSLGLKAMRVLGIVPPGGPATEAGTEGGRVPRDEKDR